MFIVYDSQTDDGEGGDAIVAITHTKEEAEEARRFFEEAGIKKTQKWHEKIIEEGTKDLYEHMRAYYYTLALDILRYYILEEAQDDYIYRTEPVYNRGNTETL